MKALVKSIVAFTPDDIRLIDEVQCLIDAEITILERDGPVDEFYFSLNSVEHLLAKRRLTGSQLAELRRRYEQGWNLTQRWDSGDGAGPYLRFNRCRISP